jgi:DNA-binding MarR family transcriptional regulator
MADRRLGIARQFRHSVLGWLHLVRVHDRMARNEACLLADYGLTPAQFDVLSHLNAEPGISQQVLAERLLVTKGNVAGLVDRMEAAGWVERCNHPDDRRIHRLMLTGRGTDLFLQAAPVLEQHISAQMSGLTDSEQITLMALLAKLDRVLRE